jgi:hypothetical protein
MYQKIIKIISLIIGVEAILVMSGWIFGIDSLTRIFSIGVNMAFPTAVMFFLSSIGLYFIDRTIKDDYEPSYVILVGMAFFIFLINITIFAGFFIGMKTGIENLFLKIQQYETINNTVAGLPSIPTMISFILFGLASIFSLFPGSKHKKNIEFFGYPIFTIGLVAIAGYVFGFPLLYYKFNNSVTPMAINTALNFVLLGCGLVIIGRNKITNEA